MMAEREFSALRFVSYRNLLKSFYQRRSMIPKPVKKLEKLFIAPKVRQVLYGTSQRVFTRCACAQRTGFLIKIFIKNQYQNRMGYLLVKNSRPFWLRGVKVPTWRRPPS